MRLVEMVCRLGIYSLPTASAAVTGAFLHLSVCRLASTTGHRRWRVMWHIGVLYSRRVKCYLKKFSVAGEILPKTLGE